MKKKSRLVFGLLMLVGCVFQIRAENTLGAVLMGSGAIVGFVECYLANRKIETEREEA
jgi:hypothetical protein